MIPKDVYTNDLEGAAGFQGHHAVPDYHDDPRDDYDPEEPDEDEDYCGCGQFECPAC